MRYQSLNKIIYLVIPCYNEEEVLPETSKRLKEKMGCLISSGKISNQSKIMFVNDGSKDKTWEIMQQLYKADKIFSCVNLSRNKGHQAALLAGLFTAYKFADAVISLDADLQDDIEAVDKFIDEFYSGYDIVYGVRNSRKTDSVFKRFTAQSFYRLMKMMGVEIIYNHADYRLMSKRAIESLTQFEEVNMFLRGIIPLIGYPSTKIEYARQKRFAGKTKYSLRKMFSFAFEGISSFSVKPIKLIKNLGLLIFLGSIALSIYYLIGFLTGKTVEGWTSLMISIWMLGGIQLFCVGIVGEFVGKVYLETKKRPRYFIESILNDVNFEEKIVDVDNK